MIQGSTALGGEKKCTKKWLTGWRYVLPFRWQWCPSQLPVVERAMHTDGGVVQPPPEPPV